MIFTILKPSIYARQEFYELLKQVNIDHEPVVISASKQENNAVIISQKDWNSIQETLKINPYFPNQSFEKLQPKRLGRYSRRINHQHRVVYTVDERKKEVYIYSA